MERRLREANGASNAVDIEASLIEIGAANRDAGAGPVNDRGKWFAPADATQEVFVAALLLDGPRRNYVAGHTGRNLPRGLLRERIRGTAMAQINAALVDDKIRTDFSGVVSKAADNEHLWKGKWKENANEVNAVVLNLWGIDFTLTGVGGLDVQITAVGLTSLANVFNVTTLTDAKESLRDGLERLFDNIKPNT